MYMYLRNTIPGVQKASFRILAACITAALLVL
jgi:hypothetical protein